MNFTNQLYNNKPGVRPPVLAPAINELGLPAPAINKPKYQDSIYSRLGNFINQYMNAKKPNNIQNKPAVNQYAFFTQLGALINKHISPYMPNIQMSNSTFAFFSIILFFVLLKIGMALITKYMTPSTNPHLIDGMINASQMKIIEQKPSAGGARTILKSRNEPGGSEFTWSVWLFIDNLTYNAGKYKHIFHKGSPNINDSGLNEPNNAPGLYIAPNTNELVVIMNTFNIINEEITIPNIPLNKWINVVIRCTGNIIDIYMNGTIIKSHALSSVPKQNYGNVYIAMDGGFSGNISDLWYYDHAIDVAQITKVVTDGPNKTLISMGDLPITPSSPNYLSDAWYTTSGSDATSF